MKFSDINHTFLSKWLPEEANFKGEHFFKSSVFVCGAIIAPQTTAFRELRSMQLPKKDLDMQGKRKWENTCLPRPFQFPGFLSVCYEHGRLPGYNCLPTRLSVVCLFIYF